MIALPWIALWTFLTGQGDVIRGRLFVQAHIARYGVATNSSLQDRQHREDVSGRLGFGGVGLPFEWFRIEAVRGRRSWARTDSIVCELTGRGLRAYGLLAFSPRWAVPPEIAPRPRSEAHRPVVDGSSARGDTAFARFAAEAARRYRGRIDRWEVWNEENHPAFWFDVRNGTNAGPSAPDYATLFVLTRDSILAAVPGAEVAVGGLASFSGHVRDVEDELNPGHQLRAEPSHLYLRALLKLGVRPAAVAIHPYSVVPPGARVKGEGAPIFPTQVVDSVFDVLDAAGLKTTKAWITEWGVDAARRLSQAEVDSWYRAGLLYLLCHPRISFVTLYTLTDPDPHTHFGLLSDEGIETPDGHAVRVLLAAWPGCSAGTS